MILPINILPSDRGNNQSEMNCDGNDMKMFRNCKHSTFLFEENVKSFISKYSSILT